MIRKNKGMGQNEPLHKWPVDPIKRVKLGSDDCDLEKEEKEDTFELSELIIITVGGAGLLAFISYAVMHKSYPLDMQVGVIGWSAYMILTGVTFWRYLRQYSTSDKAWIFVNHALSVLMCYIGWSLHDLFPVVIGWLAFAVQAVAIYRYNNK
jgi:hypothetical protein